LRIAITGVSGFLGGVIATYLAGKGHEIYAHENKTPISAPIKEKVFKIISGDLSLPETQKNLLSNVDILCHVAAYIPGNLRDLATREKCILVNTILTQDLALQCKEIGVGKFIFLSAANFYKSDGLKPATERERVNIDLVESIPYLFSKYAAEQSIDSILKKKNFVILRVATPFGLGEPTSKVVPYFITCAKKNLPIKIFGTGDENINLVHSDDVAKAVELSATGVGFGTYNISSSSISVTDLANRCVLASGVLSSEIIALKKTNIFSFSKINSERAKFELNWHPLDLNFALKKYAESLPEKKI
jgi:UDP-glucose 4-epimerase